MHFVAFGGRIRHVFNTMPNAAAVFTQAYTSAVNLLSPRLFHLHVIHGFFPLSSLCFFFLPSAFLLQTVVVSILVERQCGSELGGECSQG